MASAVTSLFSSVPFILLLLSNFVVSVRDVRLVLPTAVMSGQSVRLICLFDLQGAPLYSVKWYRGQREFYRFVPRDEPPMKHFSFPGITVDVSQSDANQVKLKEIHAGLSGNFSCEVTSDAPFFRSAKASKAITVVEMADRAPEISVEKWMSDDGQHVVAANCTAFHSKPPGNLTLYLNEELVSEENLDRFITQNETPREVVSMRWTLTRQQLSDFSFSLRLKCIVNVLSFTRMTEVLLIEPRMHPEAALAVFDDASSASHFSEGIALMWVLPAVYLAY